MADNPTPDPTPDGGGDPGNQDQTFTQADVDRITGKARAEARREAERVAAERYADYDDLKKKAEGAKSLEDRIADLETKGSESEWRAQRAEIAGEFGISTKRGDDDEPSDAELFLTGKDQATMRSQAQRFAGQRSEHENNGNHVPGEGAQPTGKSDPKRDFLREIRGEG